MKRKFNCIFLSLCFLITLGTVILGETKSVYAAVIGDTLKAPESGWKRFDNINKNIKYNDLWDFIDNTSNKYDASNFYNETLSMSKDGYSGSTCTFKFSGTKFRIIGSFYNNTFGGGAYGSTESTVVVDGVIYRSFSNRGATDHQKLLYNVENLNNGIHTVTITNMTSNYLAIDAIDIDSSGKLIDANTISISEILFNKHSLTMSIGESQNLIASIKPEDAENKELIWTSSDENVCIVDKEGNIKAVGEGKATVTAVSKDGSNVKDVCNITVFDEDNRGVLNVYMIDGRRYSYDLSMMEVDNFVNWYDERSEGRGKSFYLMKITYSTGIYTSHTDCLRYDDISYFSIDTYRNEK